MALSLVLLVGAGLFLRSFVKLTTLDLGFDRANILMMHTEARTASIPPEKWMATWDEIERRLALCPACCLRAVPNTPVSGYEWNQNIHADAPSPPTGDASLVYLNAVTPAYFRTLRIPLLAGRDFSVEDSATSPKVALINQTMARKFYSNLNPLGRFFRMAEDQGKLGEPIQIVGVVRDSKYESLREGDYACAYFPVSQTPGFGGGPNFLIRTAVRPSALVSLIQSTVAGVDKSISLQFDTLARQVDDSLVQERVLATLSGFFGGSGVAAGHGRAIRRYKLQVTLRQTEFGVRMALGASELDRAAGDEGYCRRTGGRSGGGRVHFPRHNDRAFEVVVWTRGAGHRNHDGSDLPSRRGGVHHGLLARPSSDTRRSHGSAAVRIKGGAIQLPKNALCKLWIRLAVDNRNSHLWFSKTRADCKIDNIAAALPPLFCYNSGPCFDSLSCASERWFASCGRVGASSRISRSANNLH